VRTPSLSYDGLFVGGRLDVALVALLLAAPLACGAPEGEAEHDVAVRVEQVGLDANDLPVVVLAERDGRRWLPIWIGSAEASSIAIQIESVKTPRPNTHDLANRLIAGLQGKVARVVVDDLQGGTYYATLTLRSHGRSVEIDARPSDAIAIALRAGAPIFVRERLFTDENAGAPRDPHRSI